MASGTSRGVLAALLVTASLAVVPSTVAEGAEVKIRYLGNAGFLVAAGETKVLVDALYGDGLAGYPVVPEEVRERAEAGEGDLAGIDLVLASHRHGDHFDARAVARHLDANPGAHFLSSAEAAALVLEVAPGLADRVTGWWPAEGERATFQRAEIRVTAFRLDHGAPAQNLGLLVEIGGLKVMHFGDAEVTAEQLRPLGLAEEGIDVALVPYWYFISPRRLPAIEELGARHLVAMHLPASDAPPGYFAPAEGLDSLVSAIRETAPEAWIPLRPQEARSFGTPAGS